MVLYAANLGNHTWSHRMKLSRMFQPVSLAILVSTFIFAVGAHANGPIQLASVSEPSSTMTGGAEPSVRTLFTGREMRILTWGKRTIHVDWEGHPEISALADQEFAASSEAKPGERPTQRVTEVFAGPAESYRPAQDPQMTAGQQAAKAGAILSGLVELAVGAKFGPQATVGVVGGPQQVALITKSTVEALPNGAKTVLLTRVVNERTKQVNEVLTVAYDDTPVDKLREINLKEGIFRVINFRGD